AAPEVTEFLIDVDRATIRFGGLTAVCDFSLQVKPRELLALIGPNGAGKTTVFNMLTGVYPPTEGRVRVAGRDTRGLAPHVIAHLGLARTFQNIRLFRELTAFDNVRVAFHHLTRESMAAAVRQGELAEVEEKWVAERSDQLLAVMGLGRRPDTVAENMPYGEQRRLAIARGHATEPKALRRCERAARPRRALRCDPRAPRYFLPGRRRGDRHLDRRERRRQDDDAARSERALALVRRDHRVPRRAHRGAQAAQAGRARPIARARGA